MSDRWAVAVAVAVFCGALAAIDGHVRPVPPGAGLGVLAVAALLAVAGRVRPEVWCLGAALLAAALAHRSLTGLEAPLATGPVQVEVVLVGDPTPAGRGGVRVDVRLDGRRLRAEARAAAAAALDDRLAGERVTVIGRVRPPGTAERRLAHRHLAGRLTIETVVGWRPGDGATRLANGLRRTLAHGAESLSERHRSLLAGVVLGDDRAQPADMTDAFRASGLTHLLAVSGQNVAFVLAVAGPVLTRLRFGTRLGATLAVLALFALVTRAEPSVLRAVAMASVAAAGVAAGRPASTVRTLALGVAGILLVDPLLATSLGFRLSVAGAAGIVVGAARLEAALPGPRWLTAPLSVTLAAQAAVSPLLVAAFDSVPVASLPANLLAAPAAGPIMVWGLTGGLAAGVAGGTVAGALHLPTRALLAWLDGAATTTARWPLGDLRAGHLWVLAAATVMLVGGRRLAAPGSPTITSCGAGSSGAGRLRRPTAVLAGRTLRGAAASALVAVTVAAAVTSTGADAVEGEQPLGTGATLWRGGGAAVLVLDGRASDDAVLGGLRRARVTHVDVVILRTPARGVREVLVTLQRARPVGAVLAPVPQGARPGDGRAAVERAVSPPVGTALDVGGLRLTVVGSSSDRLEVRIDLLPHDLGGAATARAARWGRMPGPGWWSRIRSRTSVVTRSPLPKVDREPEAQGVVAGT